MKSVAAMMGAYMWVRMVPLYELRIVNHSLDSVLTR